MKDKFNNQFATQRLRTEMSNTSGPGSATVSPAENPKTGEQAFPRATKKVVRKKLKKEERDVEPKLAAGKAPKIPGDWTDAPSIPNRPSKGGFIYKQLFESEEKFKKGDRFKLGKREYEIEKRFDNGDYKLKSTEEGYPGTTATEETLKRAEKLNENYSRFKKETRTRTNEQQLHVAMRLAEKKIHEANRILEYTSKLRTELTETRVNKNTQKLMERITRGIAEAYGKMKKLK